MGDYKTCVDVVNSISVSTIEETSRRSRYIYAEALTCKGRPPKILVTGSLVCTSKHYPFLSN